LLEGAIPLAAGICLTLLAFRVIGKRSGSNGRYDAWHSRFEQRLKTIGPMLIVIGVALAVRGFIHSKTVPATAAETWERYSSVDGAFSAEFPGIPQRRTKLTGSVKSEELRLSFPALTHYTLLDMDLKTPTSKGAEEQTVETIRVAQEKYWAERSLKSTLVREDQIVIAGIRGREMDFSVGESFLLRVRVILFGDRLYQAIALTRRNTQRGSGSKRFLESIQLAPAEK
jgi:hypothetical protein